MCSRTDLCYLTLGKHTSKYYWATLLLGGKPTTLLCLLASWCEQVKFAQNTFCQLFESRTWKSSLFESHVAQKGGKRKKEKQDGEWLVLYCWCVLGLADAGVSVSYLPISFILVTFSLQYNKRCQLCWEMPVSQGTAGEPWAMNWHCLFHLLSWYQQ